ncbi:CRAL-TRIO domain-containing protein [Polychytrium aggregatum]|uniref:CRAL-TRIO domain-containing protein n=1 Tax=Polychytrium aggregatum TaxID=110093 RepID=UPI0022FDFD22|nr:CRAL-TRIO domain-containing protein [Polychytrium aggregatum]KAI9209311.1 CRAL-TRIO domain-containing protein [Polychytrium aggregatum]
MPSSSVDLQSLQHLRSKICAELPQLFAEHPSDNLLHQLCELIDDDTVLYRFCQYKAATVDSAYSAIVNHLNWRIKRSSRPSAGPVSASSVDSYIHQRPIYFFGQDLNERPVMWIKTKLLDPRNSAALPDYVAHLMDLASCLVRKTWLAKSGEYPPSVFQICIVMDLEGAGIGNMSLEMMPQFFELFTKQYPMLLGPVRILNYGWVHAGIWTVVKPSLSADAKNRISFVSKDELRTFIAADQIPQEYGGLSSAVPLDGLAAFLAQEPSPRSSVYESLHQEMVQKCGERFGVAIKPLGPKVGEANTDQVVPDASKSSQESARDEAESDKSECTDSGDEADVFYDCEMDDALADWEMTLCTVADDQTSSVFTYCSREGDHLCHSDSEHCHPIPDSVSDSGLSRYSCSGRLLVDQGTQTAPEYSITTVTTTTTVYCPDHSGHSADSLQHSKVRPGSTETWRPLVSTAARLAHRTIVRMASMNRSRWIVAVVGCCLLMCMRSSSFAKRFWPTVLYGTAGSVSLLKYVFGYHKAAV